MEDLPLGRIAALMPEFAVKDLALGRTLMMMISYLVRKNLHYFLCPVYSMCNIPSPWSGPPPNVGASRQLSPLPRQKFAIVPWAARQMTLSEEPVT